MSGFTKLTAHGVGLGGSNIKSIQTGSISGTATTLNVAISSVDLSKSILYFEYDGQGSSTYPDQITIRGQMTSDINIQFNCFSVASYARTIKWTVIEFKNVKSVQRGTVTTSYNGIVNTTISSVDLDKSILFTSCTFESANINGANFSRIGTYLSTATNLVVVGRNNPIKVDWQVIEFM